jgi:hypothetical protein
MGKAHAVWYGEQAATGEWLLLTDADVVLSPGCCRQAMAYALHNGYDHLVLQARVESPSYWSRALGLFWMRYLLVIWWHVHRVNDPATDDATGWGPFNLVRRSTYHAIGTHAAFRFDLSEDLRLGERVKWMGFRQHLLDGVEVFTLEWHPTLMLAMRRIQKNFFEGANYSRRRVLIGSAWMALAVVEPWIGIWRSRKINRLFLLGTIATQLISFLFANRRTPRTAVVTLPSFPVVALLWIYLNIQSMRSMLSRGGLSIRDTFYPFEDLVRGRRAHSEAGKKLREETAKRRSAEQGEIR